MHLNYLNLCLNVTKFTLAGTTSLFVCITCGVGVIMSGETFWDSIIECCNDDVTMRLWCCVEIWDLAEENPIVLTSPSLFITLKTHAPINYNQHYDFNY